MPSRFLSILTVAALLSLWIAPDPARAATGTVDGAIRFALEDGTVAPAAGTRVYLMRAAVAVPDKEIEHGLIVYSAVDRINTAHQKFYVNLQNLILKGRHMAAVALVDENNTFRFKGLEAGDYFVVVAFPSMLDGYKVAWQVPVQVAAQRTATVTLKRGNLALPTFSRRHGTTVVAAGQ